MVHLSNAPGRRLARLRPGRCRDRTKIVICDRAAAANNAPAECRAARGSFPPPLSRTYRCDSAPAHARAHAQPRAPGSARVYVPRSRLWPALWATHPPRSVSRSRPARRALRGRSPHRAHRAQRSRVDHSPPLFARRRLAQPEGSGPVAHRATSIGPVGHRAKSSRRILPPGSLITARSAACCAIPVITARGELASSRKLGCPGTRVRRGAHGIPEPVSDVSTVVGPSRRALKRPPPSRPRPFGIALIFCIVMM
jgi:hypothetical protein